MKNSLVRILVGVCVTAMIGLRYVAAADYLSIDFQSDTVGAPPSNTYQLYPEPPFTDVITEVVDSGSTHADPFGGAGNKSLFTDDNSTFADIRVAYKGVPGGVTVGTFKAQVFLDKLSGNGQPYANIRVGQDNAGQVHEIAMWLLFNHGVAPGKMLIDQTTGPLSVLDNPMPFDTVLDLELHFDSTAKTVSGTLNGDPLTADGGTRTSWDYYAPMDYIEAVNLNTGWVEGLGRRTYFDNITISGTLGDLPGDFDFDGDVDGHDFLVWQRIPSVGSLSDWQTSYGAGTPLVANVAVVPEPATWIMLLVAATTLLSRRECN